MKKRGKSPLKNRRQNKRKPYFLILIIILIIVLLSAAIYFLSKNNFQIIKNIQGKAIQSITGMTITNPHYECVGYKCTRVDSAGENDCFVAGNYCSSGQTHLECINNVCTSVAGAGTNTCSIGRASCNIPPPTPPNPPTPPSCPICKDRCDFRTEYGTTRCYKDIDGKVSV